MLIIWQLYIKGNNLVANLSSNCNDDFVLHFFLVQCNWKQPLEHVQATPEVLGALDSNFHSCFSSSRRSFSIPLQRWRPISPKSAKEKRFASKTFQILGVIVLVAASVDTFDVFFFYSYFLHLRIHSSNYISLVRTNKSEIFTTVHLKNRY